MIGSELRGALSLCFIKKIKSLKHKYILIICASHKSKFTQPGVSLYTEDVSVAIKKQEPSMVTEA